MVVWSYIEERIDRFNQAKTERDRDDFLYRIGSHADVLNLEDVRLIRENNGALTSEQRCAVLEWMIYSADAEVRGNLVLLIFGARQLREWHQKAKAAYPDLELVLGIRTAKGTEDYLERAFYFRPLPGALKVDPDCDFPWKPRWDMAEYFWGDWGDGCHNEFDLTLNVYPDQDCVTLDVDMEDWELEPENDPDLFLIRDLLGLPDLTPAY
ncbi:hypothetical protein [Trichocoleus sp. FACHB-262]|uniref:hypothetical protein n=1 Tax=Trichocoleus sp. FACHB-262 TaxID=2692869 RepID=UPI0016866D90|nr:hypothetical protein [Trichocoleus sp. FACHB-262]MBD2123958.1 hypothetical protein [Trichocoleus sp. FACHB-262]